MFWGDEIMGDLVLRAGSWHRFLELWRSGVDSSGFWFYVFAKPWELIFGPSELSLRMFSAAGVAVAAALTWRLARRFYSLPVVAVALAVSFFELGVVRWQLSNGRCYGVFFASAALVITLIFRGEDEAHRQPSLRFLFATLLAYDILAGSHILGLVYAGGFLGIQLLFDLRARGLRPAIYGAALLGIIPIVLFSLGNLHSTAALGKPAFWTVLPRFRYILFLSEIAQGAVYWVIVGMLPFAFLHLHRRKQRDAVYLLLFGFLLIHTFFVLLSRVTTPIYVDRYLLPLVMGLVLLLAEVLTQIIEGGTSSRVLAVLACVYLGYLAYAAFPRLHFSTYPKKDYTASFLAQIPGGNLPIVDPDPGIFAETEYYHHGTFDRPFLYPVDPVLSLDPTTPGGVSGLHELENFLRLGIFSPDVQPYQEILARYPDFVVVTFDPAGAWLRKRILNNPQYTVTDLGSFLVQDMGFHLLRVHREATNVSTPEHQVSPPSK